MARQAPAGRQGNQILGAGIQRGGAQGGLGGLPEAFDPTRFRQQVEAARGEIAAPSLRALEQRARQQQLAGRFGNPAVQAAAQQQVLEGFGAGRGQILAGAGQAALGRELPIQQLEQQERESQLQRMQDLEDTQLARQRQGATDRLASLQIDLARQQRLEGTMAGARQRAGQFLDRSRQLEAFTKGRQAAGSLTGERAIRGGTTGELSQTASNIVRAFGPKETLARGKQRGEAIRQLRGLTLAGGR